MAIANYKVIREGNKTDIYDTIATVPFDSLSIHIDTQSDVSKLTYKYALITENTCGIRSPLSTVHETVKLRITKNIYGKAGLEWHKYQPENIYQTLGVYRIEQGALVLLDSLSVSNSTYTDDQYQAGNEYRVAIFLNDSVTPSRLKSDSGPFSQSMSNIDEAITLGSPLALANTDMFVYPNPSHGAVNIAIINAQPVAYSVTVTDIEGSTVYTNNIGAES